MKVKVIWNLEGGLDTESEFNTYAEAVSAVKSIDFTKGIFFSGKSETWINPRHLIRAFVKEIPDNG